ncbi:MAG: alkaline phosphatase family protein [Oscillatoriophycideae cyanobacterium NC_groundwater_1537_Pr4_S-0.65um_50_18]|nr:alkaline phosphatase family protein [Oscillatoriophycideae cyanobacterium NC_groundwater_1537_Pr4_S-0.65um_50_18]
MDSQKVILVILDGLRFDTAQSSMGYLAHLIETSQASLYKVQAELPTLSRPLYEVLLTGTATSVNGITANDVARLSHQTSLFHLATQQGLTTAAAAFHWFSELYNQFPFDRFTDREQHHLHLPIQHGKFYWDEAYPDSHLFADAEALRQGCHPNFMLVHPMGIDYTGHRFGGESAEYRGRAIATDSLLAQVLPRWISAGYEILITADHGMNADGQHGGIRADVRETPLFCISSRNRPGTYLEGISQLAIAPLICQLLALPYGKNMRPSKIPGWPISAESSSSPEQKPLDLALADPGLLSDRPIAAATTPLAQRTEL